MSDRRPISALPGLLRDARFMRGLTLAEAGEQIGISASTLMRWEKGTGSPSFDQLNSAASWLGLEIALLRSTPGEHPTASTTEAR